MERTGQFSVIVGNIGTVRANVAEMEARKAYVEYVRQSKSGYGRAAGESVYLIHSGSGELVEEYVGTQQDQ